MALVFEPEANDPIPIAVRVPFVAMENALMLLDPVFATYPNFPFGELTATPGWGAHRSIHRVRKSAVRRNRSHSDTIVRIVGNH